MKRKWQHPELPGEARMGRRYWRGLGELEDTSEFRGWLEREFPRGASELQGPEADDESRRSFLKLMGAATALAGFGMAGCRRPTQFLVPYTKSVEWVIPGKALLYTTAMPRGADCTPMVVTTFDGRPTKVDGNPLHPGSAGGSDHLAQASVLDLYDPDRSKHFVHAGERSTSEAFDAFLDEFRKLPSVDGGKGVAFLVGESSSPTEAALMAKVRASYPKSRWFRYEPLSPEPLRQANARCFGEGVRQLPRFDRADRVLALNCDFLGTDAMGGDTVNAFSKKRRLVNGKKDHMNRLYVVEPAFTLTGGMADHRLRFPASQVLEFALMFAGAVSEHLGDDTLKASLKSAMARVDGGANLDLVNRAIFNTEWIETCAKDLASAKGKSLVVAGPRQSQEIHLIVAMINEALGSFDFGPDKGTIELLQTREKALPGIAELAGAIGKDEISTLFVSTSADPVYDAPGDLNFRDLYASVHTTVHLGERYSATARASTWHVPGAHYLERWGDALSARGVYSVIQPMVLPFYGGHSVIELLLKILTPPAQPAEGAKGEGQPEPAQPAAAAAPAQAAEPAESAQPAQPAEPAQPAAPAGPVVDDPGPAYHAVRETFGGRVKGGQGQDVDTVWNNTLRDGFLAGSGFARVAKTAVNARSAITALNHMRLLELPWKKSLEVIFATDSSVYDGRYVNNAWLQEVPDPVTKLTWDNAALMSFATARELGVTRDGQMITVKVRGKSLTLPGLISPGHADYSLTIPVGYGQDMPGRIGSGAGFDVYPLRFAGEGEYLVLGAEVTASDEVYPLALTSEHYSMEGRALAREGTLESYREDPAFAKTQGMDAHIPPNISLYKGPDFFNPDSPLNRNWPVDPLHQWGMTIDLNSCIGCNACVIACQSENNIPIVGKDQVMAGREMHWIRMDRYFSSPVTSDGIERGRPVVDDDRVEMQTQPVYCLQCEIAPCETVCPVNATVHSDDGLNAMAYNRCIGTRYCANNCPYKARRFNFFDYNKRPLNELYQGPLAAPDGEGTTPVLLQKNPNVTVRMRGVIEKCTYCVQRIQTAKIAAKREAGASRNFQVPANAIKVACEQACPAEAIVFGNLVNPQDHVTEIKKDPRNYELLKYVGTLPRTTYMARVRNPNMEMPGAEDVGQTTARMH